MSKAIIEKKGKLTDELANKIKNAKSFLVFEYLGLSVKELTNARSKIHNDGATIEIVKNNILNRALKLCNITIDSCVGPNAIVICNDDEICGFKVVSNLIKEKKFIKFKFGYFENKIVSNDNFNEIASLQNRNGMYSMLLSCLTSGIRNFLYSLTAINNVKQQQSK